MRVPLSAPHLTGQELEAIERTLESNWVGPVGPDVDAFEAEFAERVGAREAVATTSGTAGIHLALRVLGVGPGDDVLVSTLTFCASVNPILYLGASPVFVDSEARSWNLDPALLADELDRRGEEGRLPAAVVVVHLYGQIADMTPILARCRRWGVPVVEDAAEALGAEHAGDDGTHRHAGTVGDIGVFSFDASKIITTSMGGMIVSDRTDFLTRAKKLARQAREPVPHYEHESVGYNYRMSNVLASIGRVQLRALAERVAARRAVFASYEERLADLPGIEFQPEAPWGLHTRWLSCILVDPERTGTDRESLRLHLRSHGIESRPAWKPMHLQPVYRRLGVPVVGGTVSEQIFDRGLCLPSSSSLDLEDVEEVCRLIRGKHRHGSARPRPRRNPEGRG